MLRASVIANTKLGPDYFVRHQWLLDYLGEPSDRTTDTRNAPRSELEWSDVIALASQHGVRPILYERLTQRQSPSSVSERALQDLRNVYLMNGSRNALLYVELAKVLRGLQQNNIPVILLKGAHLAALVYEHPALRTMADLDLLVRKGDLARAVSVLRELGYSSGDSHDTAKNRERGRHLPRMFKPPGIGIEIHWTITGRVLPFSVDTDGLWERARPASIAGVMVDVLSPEDLLLHLCVHTASHSCLGLQLSHAPFRLGLRPLYDIAAVLQRHQPDLDWQQVQRRATEWQAGKCVYISLRLVKELLRVEAPESVLEFLRPTDFDERWSVLARHQVALAGAAPLQVEAAYSTLGSFMNFGVDSALDARRRKLRLLWQAAFPPREHMVIYMSFFHSLELNPIRNYTCYLTRAVDWLSKAARLAWHSATHRRQAALSAREMFQQRQFWRWLARTDTEPHSSEGDVDVSR